MERLLYSIVDCVVSGVGDEVESVGTVEQPDMVQVNMFPAQ